MGTLAVDKARTFEIGDLNDYDIIALDDIYEGAAVGMNASGFVRPLIAGDIFKGFAMKHACNSAAAVGAGAEGANRVQVRTNGVVELTVTGVAVTDVGKDVYASDDDTFTLTATGNTLIGKVYRYVGTNTCLVQYDIKGIGLLDYEFITLSFGGGLSTTITAQLKNTAGQILAINLASALLASTGIASIWPLRGYITGNSLVVSLQGSMVGSTDFLVAKAVVISRL